MQFLVGLNRTACAMTLATVFAVVRAGASADAAASTDWSTVGGDSSNARYSSLATINTRNIRRLGGMWRKELPAQTRTPAVVANGMIIISDASSIYALDPRTGNTLWTYRPEGAAPARGGVTVASGVVYCGLSDTRLLALEQRTGHLIWTSYVGNPSTSDSRKVNFGFGIPEFDSKVGTITNAPTYINGVITTGISGGDGGTRGKIAGVSATDGRHLWDFYVIPSLGEQGSETWPNSEDALSRGGGAVWTVGAADPDLGLVYYGTGNPVPVIGGETRAGNNLYTDSVVALDARTGKLKWHFQLTHHDIWEMDVATPVVLFTSKTTPKRKALAVMRADGMVFVLDRRTGGPLNPIEERPVRQDVRQRTAATQPFPVGADRLGPECADLAKTPPGFVAGCHFQPLYFDRQDIVLPLTNVRQAPMAYDPRSGYFYAMGVDFLYWYRRVSNPYAAAVEHPPGSSEEGVYAAIDSRSGKIVWERRSPWGLEMGSGALITAGGLLFHVEGDGNLVASDSANGRILWEFQTGDLGVPGSLSNAGAVPLSAYEFRGEEYILMPIGSALWNFKLDGRVPPRPAARPPIRTFGFNGIIVRLSEGDEIGISAVVADIFHPDKEHFVDEFAYVPQRARVKKGQHIRWTNYGVEVHTIVSSDGTWTTGQLLPGQATVISIDKPGVYTYFAKEYPFARGELFVQ